MREKPVDRRGDPHMTDHFLTLKKALSSTPLCLGVMFFFILFFRNNMRHQELCSAADPLFQNRAHFWSGKSDSTFPKWRDGFCFATAREPTVPSLQEKMSCWYLMKKTTTNSVSKTVPRISKIAFQPSRRKGAHRRS